MKNNFQPVIRITWGIIILCLVAIIMLIKIYLLDNSFSNHDWDFLVYSIPLLISSFVFIMFLYNLKRAYAQGETELNKSNCIAKWNYEEEEWSKFNKSEWRKSRNKSIAIPLGILVLFYIIGLLNTEFSLNELAVAGICITLFLVTLSAALFFYTYSLYKRTHSCPREVIIGLNGFLYGGYYNGWNLIGTRLAGVKLIPGEITALQFNIEIRGKYGYAPAPVRIPVPKGHEGETNKVIAELNKK